MLKLFEILEDYDMPYVYYLNSHFDMHFPRPEEVPEVDEVFKEKLYLKVLNKVYLTN